MSTRVRVVTPELLDGAVAALINTNGTASRSAAVAAGAGGGTVTATGVATATPNTLVQRDANARTQFATPAVAADAATKGYVDTTVAGYVPTTSLGAASGVATLDGSGFITTSQVPQTLGRFLGSGTSLPASGMRAGDTYYHTGIACLFEYNGSGWFQGQTPNVANATARTTLSTNYPTVLYAGFQVWQVDTKVSWQWTGSAWQQLALFSDTGWQTIVPNSPVSAGADGCSWRQMNGMVEFQLHIVYSGAWGTGFNICTFPVGSRPGKTHWYDGLWFTSDQRGEIKLATDGSLTVSRTISGSQGVVVSGSFMVG